MPTVLLTLEISNVCVGELGSGVEDNSICVGAAVVAELEAEGIASPGTILPSASCFLSLDRIAMKPGMVSSNT